MAAHNHCEETELAGPTYSFECSQLSLLPLLPLPPLLLLLLLILLLLLLLLPGVGLLHIVWRKSHAVSCPFCVFCATISNKSQRLFAVIQAVVVKEHHESIPGFPMAWVVIAALEYTSACLEPSRKLPTFEDTW